MKTLTLIIMATGFSIAVSGQDIPQSQVPSPVLNALQSKFSNAKDLEWEMSGDLYKAEFEIGRNDHDVWIDKSGNIVKHREDFPKAELPAAIRQKIETEFKDYTIDDVDKIETDGKVFYEVDLDSRSGDRDVLFTSDGNIQEGIN